MIRTRVLLALAALALVTGAWFAFTAPTDQLQGEFSRLLNVHAPAFWVAFLAFGVTAASSVAWLLRRNMKWDRFAEASAEIGTLFTAIGLFVGMVWGQAVWGRAWDWGDARLATTAVMFFVYLGYLALRRATPDPTARARRSAIFGAVAVIQVPLVYFSVNLFRTLHQTQSVRPDGSTMPDGMLIAMGVNMIAFTIVYLALMSARLDVAVVEADRAPISVPAGDGISSPRLSEVEDV